MEPFGNMLLKLVDNHRSLDPNTKDLKRKLEDLNALKEDTESRLKVELQPRKKCKEQVHGWLKKVERVNGEAWDLEHEIAKSWTLLRGFHTGKVLETVREVEYLLQRGQSFQGLVVEDHTCIGQVLSTTKLVGNAAEICMEEIWRCLMNDDIAKIGVWGMGGLGKTTIMKMINNQLLKKTEKFNIVIWINVSKEMNISKIQKSILRAMKVELDEDMDEELDEETMAGLIYERLTSIGKYVLILDDLWDKLSLEEVGIPKPSMGSKLVVTTRKLEVCRYLDCREIKMRTLPKEDAKSLFWKKVGRDVLKQENLSQIVESVIDQCAGLPLAIVTLASCMKGITNVHEWSNALNELCRPVKGVIGLDEAVLQPLQFSYDHLQDERLQRCFLCCALYPEDYSIPDYELIDLWIDEGLVEEMDSEQAEFDKGYAILNKLKSNCLLEEGETIEHVKLHDLVRDMALRITSVRPRFLVRAGMQLKKLPHVREWTEDLCKVSLMENYRLEIPLQMSPPKCRMLTTLLLSNCLIEYIPNCFFKHMKGLKVLDLSKNYIEELPRSISNLKALTVLLLLGCKNLKNMPSLSKLRALKKLNLGQTRIENLPHGMKMLVNLNYLHVDVEEVSSGILSELSCMRHLVAEFAFVKGEEIGELEKLEVFKGRFYDLNELNTFVQALHARRQQLSEYIINVGGKCSQYWDYPEKSIELGRCKISRNGVEFPCDVQNLIIDSIIVDFPEEAALFSRFIPTLNGKFSSLKVIDIWSCQNVKMLFPSSWVLRNLPSLEELSVSDCKQLKEIITSEAEFIEENRNSTQFTLPNLKLLSLGFLPELKSIWGPNGVMVCDSLQEIRIVGCPKLQRTPLYLPLLDDGKPSPPPPLKTVRVEFPDEAALSWLFIPTLNAMFSSLEKLDIIEGKNIKKLFSCSWVLSNLQNLEELSVSDMEELEEIVEEDGTGSSNRNSIQLTLPKLRILTLWNLGALRSICGANRVLVCDSLEEIRIYNCPKLERMPLYLPLLDDGQPSPPPSLKEIFALPVEWWASVKWDHPNAKSLLEPFLGPSMYSESDSESDYESS